MTFYQLAFRYLKRKRSKTILLFLVFLLINTMILSTNMILRSTQDSKMTLQEKANAKIIAEIKDEKHKILESQIEKINKLEEVATINRKASNVALPIDFHVVSNNDNTEVENRTVSLLSYDDASLDSAFSDKRYRLSEGELANNTQQGIVINSLLADINNLKIGDMVELETLDANLASVEIVGLFLSGNESKQDGSLLSINRIENQIFMDHITYAKLYTSMEYESVSIYTKQPTQLEALSIDVKQILGDTVELTTSDVLYRQMEAPLQQVSNIMTWMLVLSFLTGIIIISLLLCMWMRLRKKEIAIFISLGYPKVNMYCQILFETFLVFFISMLCACGSGSVMTTCLQAFMTNVEEIGVTLQTSIQTNDIGMLFLMGSLIVLIAVGGSLLPVLKANPKDTLSKMEG